MFTLNVSPLYIDITSDTTASLNLMSFSDLACSSNNDVSNSFVIDYLIESCFI